MPNRLLFTGCPRSGTQWISRAITAAGVECGHEQAFSPSNVQYDGWLAESSWCAAPYSDIDGVYVVHLVRNPLAQIASQLARPENKRRAPWHRFAEFYCPRLERGMDPLDWAAHMWVGWNLEVCGEHERIRLEDITAADVTRWARIVDPDAPGITELPPPSHQSKRPPPTVTWEHVEHVPGLVEVAAEYGYPRDRGADRTPAASAR